MYRTKNIYNSDPQNELKLEHKHDHGAVQQCDIFIIHKLQNNTINNKQRTHKVKQ